jgi:protein-S-isoprenylcysteine O-methyltransferase Ste14
MCASVDDDRSTWFRPLTRVTVADVGERVLVLSVYMGLVWRLVIPITQLREQINILLLISEGLVVAFLLVRRPAARMSTDWREWAVALTATLVPMFVNQSNDSNLAPAAACAALLLMGLIIQVHAKLALGRSFGCVPAHRGLKMDGPYRFVRHPMYCGYLLSHMGFLLMNPTMRNVVVYGLSWALQVPRIFAEERLLSSDLEYRDYRVAVRYRMIPGFF